MYTFYVVVWHLDLKVFSTLNYKSDNEILTESDLLNIEDVHAVREHGMMEVKTQIISWQRINS